MVGGWVVVVGGGGGVTGRRWQVVYRKGRQVVVESRPRRSRWASAEIERSSPGTVIVSCRSSRHFLLKHSVVKRCTCFASAIMGADSCIRDQVGVWVGGQARYELGAQQGSGTASVASDYPARTQNKYTYI